MIFTLGVDNLGLLRCIVATAAVVMTMVQLLTVIGHEVRSVRLGASAENRRSGMRSKDRNVFGPPKVHGSGRVEGWVKRGGATGEKRMFERVGTSGRDYNLGQTTLRHEASEELRGSRAPCLLRYLPPISSTDLFAVLREFI